MPELPEVECIRRSLAEPLIGATITRATLRRPDILRRANGESRAKALLQGRRIVELKRRGKQLALCTDDHGPILVIQLGMTGSLFLAERPDSPHTHVSWRFEGNRAAGRLHFRDPRRFGGLVACPGPDALVARWSTLGPDAAAITTRQIAKALITHRGPRRTPLKALLLNQQVIAGVGNIYADEALHRAGLDPSREAGSLQDAETRAVATAIRHVLRQAIRAGGSSIRDYVNGEGAQGGYQRRHQVYGRAGLPCQRCKLPLKSVLIAQRTTVWCPTCQR